MSEEAQSHWQGLKNLRYLVVFGASYCDVGYMFKEHNHPSEEHPLGIAYPGVTYAEPDQPNWVGYLATKFSPAPGRPLVVFNYAVGGETVEGVASQIKDQFMDHIADRPEWAQWSSSDTLFATWVGINDCALHETTKEVEDSLTLLFKQQESLYEKGARNSLFVDIPPMHRTPFWPGEPNEPSPIILHWNKTLREYASQFEATHPDATVFVWSSYELFNKILDDPKKYGLLEEDRKRMGGSIWFDHIHPTTKVHKEIARDMVAFLEATNAE